MIRSLSLIAMMSLLVSSPADAAFLIRFDPSQTSLVSNGSIQTVSVDLLITHSTIDANPATLSGFTLDIVTPPSDLTLLNPRVADFVWDLGPSISQSGGVTSIGAANIGSGNVTIGTGGTARLLTLDFRTSAAVIDGTFSLDLSLRDANRNIFSAIESEFTVLDGNFTVSSVAIPEPGSLGLLGVACGVAVMGRRRR